MKNKGFTLIELMIVIVIIGILASVSIYAYAKMTSRAKECTVKSNCHTVQLVAEDFAVQNDGVYADDVDTDTTPGGLTITAMLPGGVLLTNPFSNTVSEPQNAAAAAAGESGYQVGVQNGINVGYTITGFGKSALVITLTNGF